MPNLNEILTKMRRLSCEMYLLMYLSSYVKPLKRVVRLRIRHYAVWGGATWKTIAIAQEVDEGLRTWFPRELLGHALLGGSGLYRWGVAEHRHFTCSVENTEHSAY